MPALYLVIASETMFYIENHRDNQHRKFIGTERERALNCFRHFPMTFTGQSNPIDIVFNKEPNLKLEFK